MILLTDEELSRARIFSEPLVPMPWGTSSAENAALARAIVTYRDTRRSESVAPLLAFLQRFPQSAWRPSLLANLGTVYAANGYLSRALNAWEQAWDGAKIEIEPRAKAVADFALGEFLDLSSKIGHADEIETRLAEVEGRSVTGRAAQKIGMAREALGILRFHHEEAAPSGPAALESILAYTAYENHTRHVPNATLQNCHAMPSGTTLSELKALASRVLCGAGGSFGLGAATSPLSEEESCTFGFGGDVGSGPSYGGQVGFGSGSGGGSASRGGVGWVWRPVLNVLHEVIQLPMQIRMSVRY